MNNLNTAIIKRTVSFVQKERRLFQFQELAGYVPATFISPRFAYCTNENYPASPPVYKTIKRHGITNNISSRVYVSTLMARSC